MDKRKVVAVALVGLAAVIYGISPIDIIPELFVGPLGILDDLGVVGGAAYAIYRILRGANPGTQPGAPGPVPPKP